MQKTSTILICCYNCTNTIKNTINSIKFKNNDDIDVILMVDGSKDNLSIFKNESYNCIIIKKGMEIKEVV